MQHESTAKRAPGWVGLFLRVSRPVVPLAVLVMSAPQERHLARLVGWGETTSYGMPLILAVYGAVAAVVATYVPRKSPHWWASTLGAAGAVGLAASAQIIGHMVVTGWLDVTPVPLWLVVSMSAVPALVLAHCMHLAWVVVPAAPLPSIRGFFGVRPSTAPQGPGGGAPAPEVDEAANGPETADEAADEAPEDDEATYVPDEWVTAKEAALLTGREEATVRGWVLNNPTVRTRKVGRNRLYHVASLPAPVATPEQEELTA